MKRLLTLMSVVVTGALLVPAATGSSSSAAATPHQPGDILVIDPDVPPVSTAVLFKVDPQTGARTVLSDFGGSNPNAVAVEADGDILVTDTDAGTDPSGGTSEWGALYRLSPDPATGELTRTVLSDFGDGGDTGRNPRAIAVEADGQILVINAIGGTFVVGARAVLVRIDPNTGARSIVSDFGNRAQNGHPSDPPTCTTSCLGVEPRGLVVEAGGQILVIDAQAGQGDTGNGQGVLFRVDPQTGVRTRLSNFGVGANQGSNPTSVAVEASGQILVTDEGHTSTTPLGLLFRVDPQTGDRTILSDFNTGANTGREPEGVALEANGQVLVVDKHAGPFTRGMLFRVDPQTGAREIVSDFGVGANQGGDPLAVALVPPLQAQARLVVVNDVVNDDSGTATASDWTISVTGTNPSPASFPGAEAPGTTVTLDAGAYTVSASGPAGYTTAPSADCAGTIAPGETKACTITNDDDDGAPPPAPCIVLSQSATSVSAAFSTPSTPRFAGPLERISISNCGDQGVALRARGTDAAGASATWELTNASSAGPIDSTCGLGTDIYRADLLLWNAQGGSNEGAALTTQDRAVTGPSSPVVLPSAAARELSVQVEMPCEGSDGLGQPMTMEVTLTAVAAP